MAPKDKEILNSLCLNVNDALENIQKADDPKQAKNYQLYLECILNDIAACQQLNAYRKNLQKIIDLLDNKEANQELIPLAINAFRTNYEKVTEIDSLQNTRPLDIKVHTTTTTSNTTEENVLSFQKYQQKKVNDKSGRSFLAGLVLFMAAPFAIVYLANIIFASAMMPVLMFSLMVGVPLTLSGSYALIANLGRYITKKQMQGHSRTDLEQGENLQQIKFKNKVTNDKEVLESLYANVKDVLKKIENNKIAAAAGILYLEKIVADISQCQPLNSYREQLGTIIQMLSQDVNNEQLNQSIVKLNNCEIKDLDSLKNSHELDIKLHEGTVLSYEQHQYYEADKNTVMERTINSLWHKASVGVGFTMLPLAFASVFIGKVVFGIAITAVSLSIGLLIGAAVAGIVAYAIVKGVAAYRRYKQEKESAPHTRADLNFKESKTFNEDNDKKLELINALDFSDAPNVKNGKVHRWGCQPNDSDDLINFNTNNPFQQSKDNLGGKTDSYTNAQLVIKSGSPVYKPNQKGDEDRSKEYIELKNFANVVTKTDSELFELKFN